MRTDRDQAYDYRVLGAIEAFAGHTYVPQEAGQACGYRYLGEACTVAEGEHRTDVAPRVPMCDRR